MAMVYIAKTIGLRSLRNRVVAGPGGSERLNEIGPRRDPLTVAPATTHTANNCCRRCCYVLVGPMLDLVVVLFRLVCP